ncbi:MAG: radical SAM protein [Acidobacteria bacterium]|nr:radical SAM protein [Acidobacteriota bacterium]MBI3658746.1 radical SAM protein [Acidobacteriota bacterium]
MDDLNISALARRWPQSDVISRANVFDNSSNRAGDPPAANFPLRDPGAILLISCYELGHQPLGLASPLAFLERAGFQPEPIDLAVDSLDLAKVTRARFVGLSVPMHTALRIGLRVAQQIRRLNPACHICFYGLYAGLNSHYLLENGADSIISGEYEASLTRLIEDLDAGSGRQNIEGVSRAGYAAKPIVKRLPFVEPSRRALPGLEKYARLEHLGRSELVGYVEASRGCRHWCRHCPIPPVYGGRFFVVPQDVVQNDIRRLVANGARHITFGDPDFLNGPGHALKIVRALHNEFPDVTFDFTAKVSHIVKLRALFPEFSAAGCLFVVSAIESLSDTVLLNLEKGHTRKDVLTALAITRAAGIVLRPSLVAFTPWTTAADFMDLLDFVEAQSLVDNIDPVQYTIRLLIPPGSLLLSCSNIKSFLGPLDLEGLSYSWVHPDPRMDDLQRKLRVLIERTTLVREDLGVTFDRVRKLAGSILAVPYKAKPRAYQKRAAPSSPRLTESWFC